jgi:putative MFS transporter
MEVSEKNITVAARIDRLPLFSLHRKLAVVLGLGTFFDLYDVFLGGILAPILAKVYGLNRFETSLVIGAGFFGMFLGAIILGIISDYVGRRAMYILDLLIYSIFTLLTAFSPNFTLFIIFRFLAGLGLGATPPITDVYLGEMIPHHARGRYTAWSYTLGFLGVPVVGLLGRFLVPTNFLWSGWRWLLIIGALGALIVWFIRRGLPESPRWYEIRNRSEDAERVLSTIERDSMRENHLDALPAPEEVVVAPLKKASLGEVFGRQYARRTTMLWIFQILQTVGYYGFGSLAPLVLAAKGFSIFQTLGYTTLIYLGYPIGSLISIGLVERFERKWLIVGSALVMAALGLCFGFATAVPLIVVSGFLLTVTSNFFSNAFHIYQAEIFPTRIRGTAVGTAYSLSRLTSGILPFFGVALLDASGPVAVFAAAAILMGILCLDVGILGPRSTGLTLEDVAQ